MKPATHKSGKLHGIQSEQPQIQYPLDKNCNGFTIERLAQFITGDTQRIEKSVTETVRLALIDTLGCMVVGSKQEIVINTLNSVKHWGAGTAPVIGHDNRLPAPWAAMVNAVAAHCLDFDDWEIPGNSHPSAILFPALLAAASARSVDAQQFVKAYVAGFEVITRLGEALNFEHYDSGWHTTSSLGTMGVAAAVACLLRLDEKQTANAIAISASMASGLTRQFGSNAKALHAGLAAKSGLIAAHLAGQGLTGKSDVLEGQRGFNALTAHGDDTRLASVLENLGHELAINQYGLVVKPYPCCGYTHRIIDCALAIRRQMQNQLPKIVSIKASLPDFHAAILPYHQPVNRLEALFSMPYCCAAALALGKVGLAEFEPQCLHDKQIESLIDITAVTTRRPKNPRLNYDEQDPDWLEVVDASGKTWRAQISYPLGAPQNPMSETQIYAKYEANAGAAPPAQLMNWIHTRNINQLMGELAF